MDDIYQSTHLNVMFRTSSFSRDVLYTFTDVVFFFFILILNVRMKLLIGLIGNVYAKEIKN